MTKEAMSAALMDVKIKSNHRSIPVVRHTDPSPICTSISFERISTSFRHHECHHAVVVVVAVVVVAVAVVFRIFLEEGVHVIMGCRRHAMLAQVKVYAISTLVSFTDDRHC